MIRQLRGTVIGIEPAGITIDVSGWGVFVSTSGSEALAIGDEASFHTHLAVKQDGMDLYGFTSKEELGFFELLLCVSGVGPKTALSILRRAPREALASAIGARDIVYLTRVAGLGKKAAEKIVVELAEKIGTSGGHDTADAEVFDTLVALGYTEREARRTLASLPTTLTGKEERLKAALSSSR